MTGAKTIWLAVNAASGSNDETAWSRLEQAFAAAGWTIARRTDCHAEPLPGIEEIRRSGVDVVAVFAGDGTVNAFVTGLYGWDGAVLVLPGGTMNLLARRLHGEAGPEEIIARAARGRLRVVRPTIVRSPGHDALTGVLAGPAAAWNEVREAIRETNVIGVLAGTAGAVGASTGSAKVVCREPGCGREEGYPAIELVPEEDGLAVKGYYAETIGDYLKQGAALLRRNYREGPHDGLGRYARVRLACPEGDTMALLIDGETGEAPREETFTLARCEVDLLATADA